MKNLMLVFFSVYSLASLYPQQFHSLDGIESSNGQSILLYRLGNDYFPYNPVYKFNTQSRYEEKIMNAYSGLPSRTVADYEFFPNDTANFVSVGKWGMNINFYIARNDIDVCYPPPVVYRVDISKQNPQKVFVFGGGGPVRSWDGGFTFPQDSIPAVTNFTPISLAGFDDNILFGINDEQQLAKNTVVVDTSLFAFDQYSEFLYDVNQFHIYRVNKTYGGYSLNVSSNKGDASTWIKTYQSENPIFITIDSTQSGVVYLADGRKIYKSTNNGYTFSEYKSLPSKLVGIYKKPNSEILYAASKSMIFKVTPNSTSIIKSLPFPDDVFEWFPLSIGNKWVYNSYWSEENMGYPPTNTFAGTTFMKVVKDTVIKNKSYFVVENNILTRMIFEPRMFLRIDSTRGFVYRYWQELNGEYLFHNLNAEVGDSIPYPPFPENPYYVLISEQPISYLGKETFERNYIEFLPCGCNHSLIKGFGLAQAHFNEFGGSDDYLKGCVINGVLYGDTTFVIGVEDELNPIPTEYKLEQNYPNPFNPS
ncbi:MAG TPA: hypothetical protein PKE38_17845, partial [Ignavibacteriaceae bacterium]|nr:hypothetical protein [Ignavibacteriaceae bacterium]